jgi:hypothetical protein
LVDYAEYLTKYTESIIKIVSTSPRVTIGDLIDRVNKDMRKVERSKSEIRDAILLLAGKEKVRIDAVTPKRLEVSPSQ